MRTKIYIKPGERVHITECVARVGASGTVVDTSIDWHDTVAWNQLSKNDDDAMLTFDGDKIVGHYPYIIPNAEEGEFVMVPLYMEMQSGKLWYSWEEAVEASKFAMEPTTD